MGSRRSATNNMHALISFIALFAIITNVKVLNMVRAEVDVEAMEASDKNAHEHQASLVSDAGFFNQDHLHDIDSDVESVSPVNGNVSLNGHSGRLYNYDDYYMGSLDLYPQYGPDSGYDYGKYPSTNQKKEAITFFIHLTNVAILSHLK